MSPAADRTVGGPGFAFPGPPLARLFPVRIATRPLQADAAPWDPADPELFKAIAGDQFLGVDGDLAVFRGRGGCVGHAHHGWLAVRIDGADGAHFMTPESFAAIWEAA